MIYKTIITILLALVSFLFFDMKIIEYFYMIKDSSINHFFGIVTEFGKSEYILIPALVMYFYFKNKNRVLSMKAGFVFSTVALSGIIINLIKPIVGRIRPHIYFEKGEFGFEPFSLGHAFASFPSGHSATAFGFFVALALMYKSYRYLFLFLAMMIAISRVVIAVHYPSDILIGSLIGTLTTIWLYERYFKKKIYE